MNKNAKQVALAVAALLLVSVVWWVQQRNAVAPERDAGGAAGAQRGPAPTLPNGTVRQRPSTTPTPPTVKPPTAPTRRGPDTPDAATFSVEFIRDADERATVVEVIEAIDAGGPFRYSKDGSTWQNRERRLPKQRPGHYREYTVETPGSDDRGARRIIAGAQHELYYTNNHYSSFTQVRAASARAP